MQHVNHGVVIDALDSQMFHEDEYVESLYGVQVVGGSNPLAPTREIKTLWMRVHKTFFVSGRFCPYVCPCTMDGFCRTERNARRREVGGTRHNEMNLKNILRRA